MRPNVDDMVDLISDWNELEKAFRRNDYSGDECGPLVESEAGLSGVFYTAPHAVKHCRRGKTKSEETATGGLVRLLAAETGAGYLATLRYCGAPDVNTCDDHPFKARLSELIDAGSVRMVVDLHGMSDKHGPDVSIGLGRPGEDASILLGAVYAAHLERAGLSVDLGAKVTGFRASSKRTLTAWLQARGVAAVQLEVASRRRFRSKPPEQRLQLVEGLVNAYRAITVI